MTQWATSDAAKRAGVHADVADAFLQPDGILTRMRALACGWTKPGDKLRTPDDVRWWTSVYKFPLWNPLGTYFDGVEATLKATGASAGVRFDEDVALGDSNALSRVLAGMGVEIQELLEAPCPKWLIPPGKRGQQPLPNPDCARRAEQDRRRERERKQRDEQEAAKQKGIDVVILLVVGVLAYVAIKRGRS